MTAIGDAPKLRSDLTASLQTPRREHRAEPEAARGETPAAVGAEPEIGEYRIAIGLARDLRQRIVSDQPLAMAAQAERQEESIVNSLVA